LYRDNTITGQGNVNKKMKFVTSTFTDKYDESYKNAVIVVREATSIVLAHPVHWLRLSSMNSKY